MGTVKVVVHEFMLGDVDDVEIYVAQPIWEWQQTEAGKWVMENSLDTYWAKHWDVATYQQQYRIVATLTEKDSVFFKLKWHGISSTSNR